MTNLQTSLISPYQRYALINERLGILEADDYLTFEQWEEENLQFRLDGVDLHWYLWPELAEA